MLLNKALVLCTFTMLSVVVSIPIYLNTPPEDSAADSYTVSTIGMQESASLDGYMPKSDSMLSRRNPAGLNDRPPVPKEPDYLIPSESPTKNPDATAIRGQINATIKEAQLLHGRAVYSLLTILTLLSQLKSFLNVLPLSHETICVFYGKRLAHAILLRKLEFEKVQKVATEIWNGTSREQHQKRNSELILSNFRAQMLKLADDLKKLDIGGRTIKERMEELIQHERGQIAPDKIADYEQSLLLPLDDYRRLYDIVEVVKVATYLPQTLERLWEPSFWYRNIVSIVNGSSGAGRRG